MKGNLFRTVVLICLCSLNLVSLAARDLPGQEDPVTLGPVGGGDLLISAAPSSNQSSPIITYNSDDNLYLVVWTDDRSFPVNGLDLYGQLVNSDGSLFGEEFPIAVGPGDQQSSSVTYNPDQNEFLVLWADTRNAASSGSDIYGRRVSNEGTLLGSELAIATAPGDQLSPAAAYNKSQGDYLVVWEDRAGQSPVIYELRLASDGTVVYGSFLVNFGSGPALIYNSIDGEYLLVTGSVSRGPIFTRYSLGGQRISADGLPYAEIHTYFDTIYGGAYRSIVYNEAANQYLLVLAPPYAHQRSYIISAYRLSNQGSFVGNPITVSMTATNSLINPSVVYNPIDRQYLAVWQRGISPGNGAIYGQRISQNGALLGGNFPISMAPRYKIKPAVAYSRADNAYMAVWEDGRDWARASDVYGQGINNNGSLVGANFLVSPDPDPEPKPARPAPDDQFDPVLTYNSTDDQYLVVWTDSPRGTHAGDVVGQILSSDGTRMGTSFLLSSVSVGEGQGGPSVAYNSADNQYLVVWGDTRNRPASAADIYGQRVSSEGLLIGGNFTISTGPGLDRGRPVVVYNSVDNQYLVVWIDQRNAARIDHDIYGQKVSANGTLVGTNFPISTALRELGELHVTYNSTDNQYLVVWSAARDLGSFDRHISGQRVSGSGQLLGANFPIYVAPGSQSHPSITYNGTENQYLVVWLGSGIEGRRISADGALIGDRFTISPAGGDPSVIYNDAENIYFVVWNRSDHIYGQKVSNDGTLLLRSDLPITTAPVQQLRPSAAYNAVDDLYLVVWEYSRTGLGRAPQIYGRIVQ